MCPKGRGSRSSDGAPRQQLERFIERYTPDVASTARQVLAKLRNRFPGAIEMVYDSYNALAVAIGPTEKQSEAIVSVTLYPRWVSLFFIAGASLPDPHGLLKGSGTRLRHVVLPSADDLDRPELRDLIDAAAARSAVAFDTARPNRTVIKSVAAKRRARRPA